MRIKSLVGGFLAIAAVLLLHGVAAAQDADARFQAHLAADEFGPALELANATTDLAVRDRRLSMIATAQAAAGARSAAVETAQYIQDAGVSRQTLMRIRSPERPHTVGRGGAAMADFDSLINLITTTVAPDSWEDVGGPGAIDKFGGGVYVDSRGTLMRVLLEGDARDLARIRSEAVATGGSRDARRSSPLRKISLPRLEKQVQMQWALGRDPSETMRNLAGLQKIEYVFVYPKTGDIVIAGPAGEWHEGADGRSYGVESGRPVLQLDDLVVLLRNAYSGRGVFGCSIDPRKENLAATHAYLAETSKHPLPEGGRGRAEWLRGLRDAMGKQDISVHGVDARSRVARVLVEADYRMKLVGMGLEEGTLGVPSYLSMVKPAADGSLPPMDVLRWWFTLNYDAVAATKRHDAFQLRGQGVQVQSESEMLTARGERIHTGKSDALNAEFAHNFTKHFNELATKYPIYADLRNIFDLALVAAIVRAEDLPGQAGWRMQYFGEGEGPTFVVEYATPAHEVDTIVNHRVIRGAKASQIIAGVSGGVHVDTQTMVAPNAIKIATDPRVGDELTQSKPSRLPIDAWWWD